MEIRQFTYVSMVAECGSFTKAAATLFITQPALSNYINKLEEDLGVRLFDRSVTPVKLTYAGEQYLEYAKNGQILVERYRKQLLYYREALERLTGKRVKKMYLYSFSLGKALECRG